MADNFTLPNVNDTQDLFTVFQFVNDKVPFFPVMILVIWLVAFIGSLVEGKEAVKAWIYASFVGSILAILAGISGLLARQWIYLLILFVAFGVFWIKLKNVEVTE